MPQNTREIDWGPDSLLLNREQIAQVAYNAGFRGQDLVNMVGIAMRESGGHAGLYVNRPRTGDWSYGLWGLNIGRNQSYWPTFRNMGFTDPRQLSTPEGNAKAAFEMFKARGLYPWGGYKGKSGTYSTNLAKAAAAVQSAGAKGMLGRDAGLAAALSAGTAAAFQALSHYGQPSADPGLAAAFGAPGAASGRTGTPGTPGYVPGPLTDAWKSAQRGAFTTWLQQQPTAKQQQIISGLQSQMTLPQIAQFQNAQGQDVKNYFGFLAQLTPAEQQSEVRGLAAGPPAPGAPGATPPSPALTNLLKTLGVQYPNAPQPTPALLAFLRGVGLNLSTAEDLQRAAIQRIGASTSDAMADIDRSAGRTKQNITADLVRRGVLTSGESNTRYARQAEDVGAQKKDVLRSSSQAKETSAFALRSAQDLARQQALDRVIASEQEQATQSATAREQQRAIKAAQDAADLAWQREQAARQEELRRQTEAIDRAAKQGVVV